MRITLYVVGALVVLIAGLYTWTRVNPHEIRTEIEIAAPAEQVWEVLADTEAYPEWNPFIISSTGNLEEGGQLTNEISNDGSTRTFKPRVLVVNEAKELRWIGRFGAPGIVDGEHYFILEDAGDGRTRLIQGETFTGVLVPFAGRALDVADEFNAMNTALKARVEAGRGTGTTTSPRP